ncbi:MAG: HAD family hydrolase [Dehalococcoidia bacterium]
MPIKTILFDLGNVVCRFVPERRLDLLAVHSGLSPEEVHTRIWTSGFSRDCDLGRYTAAEMFAEAARRLGLTIDYVDFRAAWTSAFEPDHAVLELVDAAADRYRTALLTDNPLLLDEALPILLPDVARRFDPRLFSAALGVCKPDIEIFRRALARLGEPAANVLFVDDTPAAVDGAREAGIEAVLFIDAPSLALEFNRRLPDRSSHDGPAMSRSIPVSHGEDPSLASQ